MTQFRRQAKLVVGDKAWTKVRMKMTVSASDAKEPNRLSVDLYNLSDDSIAHLQKPGQLAQFHAGYETMAVIGTGDVMRVESKWQGPDRVTTVSCADGHVSYKKRVKVSEKGETSTLDTIEKVAKSIGIKNVDLSALKDVKLPKGLAFIGKAHDLLDGLTKSVGASYHIRNGGLVVLAAGKATNETAVLIRADSGLIGSPETTEKGVKFKCLLNPKITLRRIVKIESRDLDGFYVIKKYTHTADNMGDEWTTECEGVKRG